MKWSRGDYINNNNKKYKMLFSETSNTHDIKVKNSCISHVIYNNN